MLVVTARLFKDNQLVGYRLSDGQKQQDFTKQQAWMYAKNKQILNVTATGTEVDPGISGTNGFELKKLPEIKWGETNNKKSRLLGYYLLVTHTLYDGVNLGCGSINKKSAAAIIGYEIKNIGTEPISYIRIAVTPEHETEEVVLQPNEEVYLNRAEVAALALRDEVGVYFANGRIADSAKRVNNEYDRLNSYFFTFYQSGSNNKYINSEVAPRYFGKTVHDEDIMIDVRLIRNPEMIAKYFGISNNSQPNQIKKLGRNILIERVLYDGNEASMTSGRIHAIGYKIINIGDKPIEYTIIIPGQHADKTYSKQILQKGEYAYLSCAELGYLAHDEKIGLQFANGTLVSSLYEREIFDKTNVAHLYRCYFSFGKIGINEGEENYEVASSYIGKQIYDQDIRLNIRDVSEIDAYSINNRFNVVVTPKKKTSSIFGMFKR